MYGYVPISFFYRSYTFNLGKKWEYYPRVCNPLNADFFFVKSTKSDVWLYLCLRWYLTLTKKTTTVWFWVGTQIMSQESKFWVGLKIDDLAFKNHPPIPTEVFYVEWLVCRRVVFTFKLKLFVQLKMLQRNNIGRQEYMYWMVWWWCYCSMMVVCTVVMVGAHCFAAAAGPIKACVYKTNCHVFCMHAHIGMLYTHTHTHTRIFWADRIALMQCREYTAARCSIAAAAGAVI